MTVGVDRETVGVDRDKFYEHLDGIAVGKQDLASLALLWRNVLWRDAESSHPVVLRFVEVANRIESLYERYADMLQHDVTVSRKSCERLEQVDIAQARGFLGHEPRVAGSDGMTSFAGYLPSREALARLTPEELAAMRPADAPARRGVGNEVE